MLQLFYMILRKRQFPERHQKPRRRKKPWFDDDCKISIQKGRQALRQSILVKCIKI